MIKRVVALLILFTFAGGITYYCLNRNPADRVEELRHKIDILLNSKKPAEWEAVVSPIQQLGKDLTPITNQSCFSP